MGFLDDLGKKVTDVGQMAVQKTQAMSETARINSLISQNENKLNNAYCQIGKLFVSIYGDDCDEKFVEIVSTAIELEQQNIAYRKQIQDIKGIQHCEKCGAEIPKGFAFCSSCGAAVPNIDIQAAADDSVKCPNCGTMVKKDMRFCTACGQAMVQPVVVSTVTDDKSSELPEDNVPEKICMKCGAKVPTDSMFCTECGTKL